MSILLDEYLMKITFSDLVKKMLAVKRVDSDSLTSCKVILSRLIKIYIRHAELGFVKVYLEEIERQGDSKMESLMKVEFLFDYFISKLKRNSFMEKFMCQSDNEEIESDREDSLVIHQSVKIEGKERDHEAATTCCVQATKGARQRRHKKPHRIQRGRRKKNPPSLQQ
jgi:hypothetical protein